MSRDIDYKNLRSDLENYYGTAMFSGAGMAMSDLSKVDRASEDKLHWNSKTRKNWFKQIWEIVEVNDMCKDLSAEN